MLFVVVPKTSRQGSKTKQRRTILDPIMYIIISISLRILLALGETAVMISGYSLAGANGGDKHQGKIKKGGTSKIVIL